MIDRIDIVAGASMILITVGVAAYDWRIACIVVGFTGIALTAAALFRR